MEGPPCFFFYRFKGYAANILVPDTAVYLQAVHASMVRTVWQQNEGKHEIMEVVMLPCLNSAQKNKTVKCERADSKSKKDLYYMFRKSLGKKKKHLFNTVYVRYSVWHVLGWGMSPYHRNETYFDFLKSDKTAVTIPAFQMYPAGPAWNHNSGGFLHYLWFSVPGPSLFGSAGYPLIPHGFNLLTPNDTTRKTEWVKTAVFVLSENVFETFHLGSSASNQILQWRPACFIMGTAWSRNCLQKKLNLALVEKHFDWVIVTVKTMIPTIIMKRPDTDGGKQKAPRQRKTEKPQRRCSDRRGK